MRAFLLTQCLLVSACALSAEALPVKAVVGERGLAELSAGGLDLLADGVPLLAKVVFRKADATTHMGDKAATQTVRDGQTLTITYPWGSISYAYAAQAGRLDLTIAVANASKDEMHELWLRPLSLKLPGEGVKLPRPRHNIGAPSVLAFRHAAGALALCNADIEKPLYLGFDRPRGGAAPVVVRAGGDRMVFDELYMRRPVPPGGRDAYRISLRFGPEGADPDDLADDVYKRFAARYPPLLEWPDRRPILRLFVSGGLPAEQVLAYYRNGEKGPLPAPDPAVRTKALASVARATDAARKVDAQGIIIWDIEGDAMAHPTTYIGDPRLAKVLNPSMDAAADDYFAAIRDAGLRCGVCIRPSHVVYAKDKGTMMQSYGAAKDPFLELDAKIRYCKERWKCTIFYVDTNYFWRPRGEGGKWTAGMIDADVWRRLLKKHPDILLVPEHNYVAYWAATAPYNELDCGYRGIPRWVRRVYPKAFCVPVVEDADPHKNHDLLVQMVRDGDCLMTFIYGMTRNAEAIRHIYAEAGLLDEGEPPAVARAAAEELARLVASSDLRTRFYAARRLAGHRGPQAAKALLARVVDPEEHWLVRKDAVVGLGTLRSVGAVQALGRLLKDRKADLGYFATQALAEISKAVSPTEMGDEPDDPGLELP